MSTLLILLCALVLLSFSALFSGLTLGLMSLSVYDLKRKAELNHPEALIVYPIRQKGNELLVMLLFGNVLVNAALAVVLNSLFIGFFAVLVSTVLITMFGEILPQAYLKKHGLYWGAKLAPYVTQMLRFTSWLNVPIGRFLDRVVGDELPHVYSKAELLKIMDEHDGDHTEIEDEDLSIARHALSFADKKIRDVMVGLDDVKAVKASNVVSPSLLNELHELGHSRYPVYAKSKDNIVGVLYARELAGKIKGNHKVRDLMQKHLYYVHADETLEHALNAFLKTKRHMFIVVESGQHILGVITIEDIIDEALGSQFEDEFSDFDDAVAVSKIK